jgi:hypothetical protein
MKDPDLLNKQEPLVSAGELSRMLNVAPGTVLDWAQHYPDFPGLHLPGAIRMRTSEVVNWLHQFQVNPPLRGPAALKAKNAPGGIERSLNE